MEEQEESKKTLGKKRGRTLNVLLILSLIMLSFRFLGVALSLFVGQLSEEEIKEQQVAVVEFYSDEMIEMLGDSLEESFVVMEMEKMKIF